MAHLEQVDIDGGNGVEEIVKEDGRGFNKD